VVDLSDTALVVVDVQQAFDDGDYWGARNNPSCEANVAALIAAWRAAERPLVFVRHEFDGYDWAFKDVVTGEPDLLVSKSVNSAFYGEPDLDAWLRSRATASRRPPGWARTSATTSCSRSTRRTRSTAPVPTAP
jgi:nicotinamidase-related amidase